MKPEHSTHLMLSELDKKMKALKETMEACEARMRKSDKKTRALKKTVEAFEARMRKSDKKNDKDFQIKCLEQKIKVKGYYVGMLKDRIELLEKLEENRQNAGREDERWEKLLKDRK